MSALYPLRFHPVLKRYLWGGRRLGTVLGKPLGEEGDYAESWEICDRAADQTIVEFGALAGTELGELVRTRAPELLGRHADRERFPLLFKFLDAQKTLSVQVHPDNARAANLTPPDLGKTEAWVVLDAEPGSSIYAGLKPGFDRAALEREASSGNCERCLHQFEPQPGDCIFLPAGVVHAIGAGLLIAEIQQNSDTTYRLYDWNRVGADGRPRALHLEQALEAIDYQYGPAHPQQPRPGARPHISQLVACDEFVLDRWRFDRSEPMGGDNRFHLIAVLSGQVLIAGDPSGQPLGKGSSALLPACLDAVTLTPLQGHAVLLDAYLL